MGDLGAHAIPDLLAAAQLFGFSACVELDLIAFVVFDRVDIALDVLDRSADGSPGRTRL